MTEEGIANQSPVAPDPLYDLYPRGQSPISSERQSQSSHQQGTSEKLTIGADALSPIMSNNAQPIQQDQKDYKQYKLKYEQNDSNRNNEDEIEDGSVVHEEVIRYKKSLEKRGRHHSHSSNHSNSHSGSSYQSNIDAYSDQNQFINKRKENIKISNQLDKQKKVQYHSSNSNHRIHNDNVKIKTHYKHKQSHSQSQSPNKDDKSSQTKQIKSDRIKQMIEMLNEVLRDNQQEQKNEIKQNDNIKKQIPQQKKKKRQRKQKDINVEASNIIENILYTIKQNIGSQKQQMKTQIRKKKYDNKSIPVHNLDQHLIKDSSLYQQFTSPNIGRIPNSYQLNQFDIQQKHRDNSPLGRNNMIFTGSQYPIYSQIQQSSPNPNAYQIPLNSIPIITSPNEKNRTWWIPTGPSSQKSFAASPPVPSMHNINMNYYPPFKQQQQQQQQQNIRSHSVPLSIYDIYSEPLSNTASILRRALWLASGEVAAARASRREAAQQKQKLENELRILQLQLQQIIDLKNTERVASADMQQKLQDNRRAVEQLRSAVNKKRKEKQLMISKINSLIEKRKQESQQWKKIAQTQIKLNSLQDDNDTDQEKNIQYKQEDESEDLIVDSDDVADVDYSQQRKLTKMINKNNKILNQFKDKPKMKINSSKVKQQQRKQEINTKQQLQIQPTLNSIQANQALLTQALSAIALSNQQAGSEIPTGLNNQLKQLINNKQYSIQPTLSNYNLHNQQQQQHEQLQNQSVPMLQQSLSLSLSQTNPPPNQHQNEGNIISAPNYHSSQPLTPPFTQETPSQNPFFSTFSSPSNP